MYSYASRIPPRDRWAIAAYIRVLQLSQHAEAANLPEEDRRQLPAEGQNCSGRSSHERPDESHRREALRTRLDLIQSRAWVVAGVGLGVSLGLVRSGRICSSPPTWSPMSSGWGLPWVAWA